MNIYNVIILDESGSMSSIYKETIQSMNEVLNGIRKDQEEHPEQHHYVTIVTFEGHGIEGINSVFFNSLKGIDSVIVFGHSCSDVDKLYFEATAAKVWPDAKWLFCYFDEQKDLFNMEQLIETIPLERNRVSFMRAEEYIRSQCGTVKEKRLKQF